MCSLWYCPFKNSKSSGKLAPNFEPQPHTFQTKEGQELTLKADDGTMYRRNSSFVKPYRTLGEPESSTPEQSSKEEKTQAQSQQYLSLAQLQDSTAETRTRPTRATKLPGRFTDFVLDKWTDLFGTFRTWNEPYFVRNSCSSNLYISLEHLLLLLFITETFCFVEDIFLELSFNCNFICDKGRECSV